jgi:hypothetical protein
VGASASDDDAVASAAIANASATSENLSATWGLDDTSGPDTKPVFLFRGPP